MFICIDIYMKRGKIPVLTTTKYRISINECRILKCRAPTCTTSTFVNQYSIFKKQNFTPFHIYSNLSESCRNHSISDSKRVYSPKSDIPNPTCTEGVIFSLLSSEVLYWVLCLKRLLIFLSGKVPPQ
jgi:hypothetical protein